MMTTIGRSIDIASAIEKLELNGYTVIEGLLTSDELEELQMKMEQQFEQQRTAPYDPGDGAAHPDDAQIDKYLRQMYSTAPSSELDRVMRLMRYNRAQNYGTPWPVPIENVLKNFLPRPEIEGHGSTVYVSSATPTVPIFARLLEDPLLLRLARSVLGDDCVLSDMSLNSIGPHTDNGAWHVDVPLGQLPEPLPEIPLTLQCIWMVDDFTLENGATRVVPRSHRSLKKPKWKRGEIEDEVAVTGPAGSMAIWYSSLWHKPGQNVTDTPRRAALCYFCRSWVKPYSDFRPLISPEQAEKMSPTLRYLLGFSSNAVVRNRGEA
jgi:hypothetical protein